MKGIGEKRAQRIEKALDGFWHRRAAAKESEATTPTESASEAATNADTFGATYRVIDKSELRLSEDELRSLSHPALASQILKGKVPNISEGLPTTVTTIY